LKHSSAVKKVEKRFGQKGIVHKMGHRWGFEHDGEIGSWLISNCSCVATIDNECTGKCDTAYACNWHVRSVGDVSDPYTDYYAGSFRDNITQVLDSICPLPGKFLPGALVMFKTNKRQTRYGNAGKVGIVLEGSNKYYKVQIAGSTEITNYISERDLAVA